MWGREKWRVEEASTRWEKFRLKLHLVNSLLADFMRFDKVVTVN